MLSTISMGIQAFVILQQGFLAALTGGWYYDTNLSLFANTFHLYTWLFLLCLPLTIYLTCAHYSFTWIIYSITIAIFFSIIKIINYRLHTTFDSKIIKNDDLKNHLPEDILINNELLKQNRNINSTSKPLIETNDGIELSTLGGMDSSSRWSRGHTPPVHCSSRMSLSSDEGASSGSGCRLAPVDSLEIINAYIELEKLKVKENKHEEILRSNSTKSYTSNMLPLQQRGIERRNQIDDFGSSFNKGGSGSLSLRSRTHIHRRAMRRAKSSVCTSPNLIAQTVHRRSLDAACSLLAETTQDEPDNELEQRENISKETIKDLISKSKKSTPKFFRNDGENILSDEGTTGINLLPHKNLKNDELEIVENIKFIQQRNLQSNPQNLNKDFKECLLGESNDKYIVHPKSSVYNKRASIPSSKDHNKHKSRTVAYSHPGLDMNSQDSLLYLETPILGFRNRTGDVPSKDSPSKDESYKASTIKKVPYIVRQSNDRLFKDVQIPLVKLHHPKVDDLNEDDLHDILNYLKTEQSRSKDKSNTIRKYEKQSSKNDWLDIETASKGKILMKQNDDFSSGSSSSTSMSNCQSHEDTHMSIISVATTSPSTSLIEPNTLSESIALVHPRLKNSTIDLDSTTFDLDMAREVSEDEDASAAGISSDEKMNLIINPNLNTRCPSLTPSTDAKKHIAETHEDTSEGAVHYFKDEHGNWLSYTFGDASTNGMASEPNPDQLQAIICRNNGETLQTTDSNCVSPICVNPPISTLFPSISSDHSAEYHENHDTESITTCFGTKKRIRVKKKSVLIFPIFPKLNIKLNLDRLDLLSLLDRNSFFDMILTICLSVVVGIIGCILLMSQLYKDIWLFILCFVVAGCQYSLLKSVQPDPASPMHGFNRLIAFSRSFYFCLIAMLLILVNHISSNISHEYSFKLYSFDINFNVLLISFRDFLSYFILFLPIIFLLGFFPQINTFLIYIIEQIEIHISGGTAITSLQAGLYSLFRTLIFMLFLVGLSFVSIREPLLVVTEPNSLQHILFSIFSGFLVSTSYHLSRYPTNHIILLDLIKECIFRETIKSADESENSLNTLLKNSYRSRLFSDLIICPLITVLVFAICVSTVFSSPALEPPLFDILGLICIAVGFILHYILPQMRKEMPWMCCSHPILPTHERKIFEPKCEARIMWFEKLHVWLNMFERNFLLVAFFLSGITLSMRTLITKNSQYPFIVSIVLVVGGMKMMRGAFACPPHQYIIIAFTLLCFNYDFRGMSETFLVDYFFMSILLHKIFELVLKLKFVFSYIAPWQITWGSPFHAFAQPFAVPHSAMLLLQSFISTFFSAPLTPLLGSAVFITSYFRAIKFWEKDYNTRHVDNSTTRLSSQLQTLPTAPDVDNLNSIFYEHLTRSLQRSLAGDIGLGRWSGGGGWGVGGAEQGDCFIMASDYLNALIHIVEKGNGFITFQLRGLEFRGTYCQQREVEAITEDIENDEAFCCCKPGHLPHFLSFNAIFGQRWLAWQMIMSKYVIDGYSISDNSIQMMLHAYDLRRVLNQCFVKSIIYYTIKSAQLESWISNTSIREAIQCMDDASHCEMGSVFMAVIDSDYSERVQGIKKSFFTSCYSSWIEYCISKKEPAIDSVFHAKITTLCFALSIVGRRAFNLNAHSTGLRYEICNLDVFLCGLHAMFKGDIRITSSHDEWVFADMDLLKHVIAPAVRMSVKLHQDFFSTSDQFDFNDVLFETISKYERTMVICHESDPAWRMALLNNVPSLLALRRVFDDSNDDYKVITLNKKFLAFRVIKLNRECVRGLWAGQLQELIFLRNRNPERGSIQNAKQVLRNMINSSCDQPIGYPIYVSPLTTSFISDNTRFSAVAGPEFDFRVIVKYLRDAWRRFHMRCNLSYASGGVTGSSTSTNNEESSRRPAQTIQSATSMHPPQSMPPILADEKKFTTSNDFVSNVTEVLNPVVPSIVLDSHVSLPLVESNPTVVAKNDINLPCDTLLLPGNLSNALLETDSPSPLQHVLIYDPTKMFDNINLGRPIDVQWPNDDWRLAGGTSGWNGWVPEKGTRGVMVHRWVPKHANAGFRSHVDKTIVLVKVEEDRYVPMGEAGIIYTNNEIIETGDESTSNFFDC